MKLPRDVSGARLVQLLCRRYEHRKVHQVGSHVILETDTPRHHRIAIPDHTPLRIGTFHAILPAVADAKGVEKAEILSHL